MSSQGRFQPKGAVTPEIMELPRQMNGEVDWNTLGNILVAHALGEVVCASYVDHLYGKEHPGFLADTDWRFSYKEKNVVVLKKQLEDSPIHCYMGRTVVDLPAREIHEFLGINESALHFDRYAVKSHLVKSIRDETDKRDGISYMRHEGKHCLMKAKRDFVFYVRWEVLDDDKCVMSTLSVDHPDCPLVPGITRGQLRPGSGWVLEPYRGDPNRTLVSYLIHVDLCELPPLLTNRVMRRQPLSVHYLAQYLLKHRQSQQRPSLLPITTTTPSSNHNDTDGHTTAEIPTPTVDREEYYSSMSSLPMESNPLYQSSMFPSIDSRSRTESWRNRGRENVDSERLIGIGTLVHRQVSIVPEENEPYLNNVSAQLLKVEAELDISEAFPVPFELTNSSRDGSLTKTRDREGDRPTSQDQWLLVPNQLSSPFSDRHSPTPVRKVENVKMMEEGSDTPDVSPGHSQGNEWTVASSNNE